MTTLYPFKFKPICKEKIWGGQKIGSYLGKDFAPLQNCGETWEISGVQSDASIVANGPLAGLSLPVLLKEYKAELVGTAPYRRYGNDFPLLVKFIDAADDLSVQAHPNDELARQRHNSPGKTEMWYVIQADEGATVIAGFNQPVERGMYLEKLQSGRLADILNIEPAQAGDVFFLPAGRVHTIGKGLLVAEIQQASDVTYRIHDFDRIDEHGNRRDLHTEEALAALDFGCYPDYRTTYARTLNQAAKVVECEYFTTNILEFDRPVSRDYSFDSFVIHVCVQGSYTLNYGSDSLEVDMGDCVLIPAALRHVNLTTETGFRILESFVV